MDGRWSLILAAGLIGGTSGCATVASRQPTGAPTEPATPQAQAKTPYPSAQVAAAPTPKITKLKPSTHVAMGALAEQMADDAARPAHEREQFRTQARQAYQKALDSDANYAPAYLALAMSYVATEERDRALAMYQKAVEVAPADPTVWAEMGSFHVRLKEWDPAVECLTQAASLAPDNKEYTKKLGFTLARAGRIDDGYAALVRCMSEAEARFNIARMLQHLQQTEAARRQLQLALRAKPDYEPAREALAALDGAGEPGVRPAGYNESATAVRPTAYAEAPAPAAKPAAVTRPAAPPAILNGPPRLPPVILGSRDAPVEPIRAGVNGAVE